MYIDAGTLSRTESISSVSDKYSKISKILIPKITETEKRECD